MSHCEYPCPCGYYGDTEKQCTCTMAMITKYQKRISGPILDSIDIHLDVQHEPVQKLSTLGSGEPSNVIRTRVEAARQEPSIDRGKRSRV